MNRRTLLNTMAAAGIATLASSMIKPPVVSSLAPQVKTQFPGFYRIGIGDFEVTALSDGVATFPMDKLLTNITAQEAEAMLEYAFLKTQYDVSMNNYLINTGRKLILVDAGAGDLFGPKVGGKLVGNLRAAGYQPEDIDIVLLTHIHADHSGGLVINHKIAFPNAAVYVHKRDSDYWLDPSNLEKAPDDQKYRFRGAMSSLNPYKTAGKLVTFDSDTELFSGIKTIQAPGHTPGHSFFSIESNGERLLLWGDIVHVAEVQFSKPSVGIKFDVEPELAITQRKKIFSDAAKQECLVGASHVSFPGLGHVREKGGEYIWIPISFSNVKNNV